MRKSSFVGYLASFNTTLRDYVFRALVLLTLAVVAVGFGWDNTNQKQIGKIYQNVQAEREKADDRIADYTWWLTFFTAFLGVGSLVQITFLIRADKTARLAAEATKISAELASNEYVANHRPRLVVRHLEVRSILPNRQPEFIFYVFNNGDSAAYLEAFNAGMAITDYRDTYSAPWLRNKITKLDRIKLMSGERHRLNFVGDKLTVDNVVEISAETATLYFFGHIRYFDAADNLRRVGFLRQYDYSHRRFSVVDDPDYEYSD